MMVSNACDSRDTWDNTVLAASMEMALDDVIDFVASDPFQALLGELMVQAAEQRAQFVDAVVLCPAQLAQRGVAVPEGLVIQRSTFADNRATLFCVSKEIGGSGQGPWHKVT